MKQKTQLSRHPAWLLKNIEDNAVSQLDRALAEAMKAEVVNPTLTPPTTTVRFLSSCLVSRQHFAAGEVATFHTRVAADLLRARRAEVFDLKAVSNLSPIGDVRSSVGHAEKTSLLTKLSRFIRGAVARGVK
jgi:hypothetical protein